MNEQRRSFLKWVPPVVTAIMLPVNSFASNSSGANIAREHGEEHEYNEHHKHFHHLFQPRRSDD